jgi:hypothetical protein
MHEERMRAEALLFALENAAISGAAEAKKAVADVGTSPPRLQESDSGTDRVDAEAQTEMAQTDACCESAEMLRSAAAELEALQQVNAQLLGKVKALQERSVVPVAEARAAVARARTAAISESKVCCCLLLCRPLSLRSLFPGPLWQDSNLSQTFNGMALAPSSCSCCRVWPELLSFSLLLLSAPMLFGCLGHVAGLTMHS